MVFPWATFWSGSPVLPSEGGDLFFLSFSKDGVFHDYNREPGGQLVWPVLQEDIVLLLPTLTVPLILSWPALFALGNQCNQALVSNVWPTLSYSEKECVVLESVLHQGLTRVLPGLPNVPLVTRLVTVLLNGLLGLHRTGQFQSSK